MRFPAIFVTGTGTDVGKTVVSAALIEAASQRQLSPLYWKPIQTGNQAEDQNAVRRLLRTAPKHCISQIPSWNFPLAASPDQAAAAASLPAPRLNELLQAFALHSDQFLVIEGAGGLLVPLNESNETWRDFIKSANLPIILVATSGLGTLNHTLLTLEALEQRGITVLAVILNGPCHEGNYTSLKRMRPEHRFYQFPQLNLDSSDPEFTKVSNDLLDFVLAAPMLHPHKDWMEADRLHCWHPYTQHKTANNPIAITGAKGIYLHTASGENLIDASASWWTNSTGHGHPKIGAAIARQQQKLDHSIFANATHEAASLLAQRLVKLSEHHLDRVFYSDNGSCAVEIALKMAAQSWQNQGQKQKNSFLFIQGSYHGDTFGAMSVGASEAYHQAFRSYLFPALSLAPVTAHRSRLCPEGPANLEQGLREMELLFHNHADQLAAVIIEPWVQAASGMNLQDLAWLQHLDKLCKKHQVLLILDEVFTGMGRLGSYFAFLRAGLKPDIVCIAKGLTGGTVPLAATLSTEAIFSKFLDDDRSKALLHGHTFTGNPIGCAAALATLDVFRDEKIIEGVHSIELRLQDWIANQGRALGLREPRAIGAMAAWELPGSGIADYFHPLAQQIPLIARRRGLFMRTLGNTMYFVPPLCINQTELNEALLKIEAVLDDCK